MSSGQRGAQGEYVQTEPSPTVLTNIPKLLCFDVATKHDVEVIYYRHCTQHNEGIASEEEWPPFLKITVSEEAAHCPFTLKMRPTNRA